MEQVKETYQLELQNKEDREAAALALFRAGYAVQLKKRRDGNKTTLYLEYWK